MQRYFAVNSDLKLLDSDIHHIKNVMRMKKNYKIEIIFEESINRCNIEEINKDILKYSVLETIEEAKEKRPIVKLAVSLIKEQKFDYLIQKVTEIGVDEIIPLKTERSIIKIDNNVFNKKKIRYNRIIKEASEQSHRVNIPVIKDLITIDELINNKEGLNIMCTVNETSKSIKRILKEKGKCDTLLLVVGPEGGFSTKKENKIIDNGFNSATLGKNILRSETAAIYLMSIVDYEFLR